MKDYHTEKRILRLKELKKISSMELDEVLENSEVPENLIKRVWR